VGGSAQQEERQREGISIIKASSFGIVTDIFCIVQPHITQTRLI
jgi:hypothetical protein